MIGLVYKDLLIFKKSLFQMRNLVPIVILAILNISFGSNGTPILNVIIAVLITSVSLKAFAFNDGKWNLFLQALNIKDYQIVLSRMFFLLIVDLFSTVFLFTWSEMQNLFFSVGNIRENISISIVTMVLILISMSILTPLIFLFDLNSIQTVVLILVGLLFTISKFVNLSSYLSPIIVEMKNNHRYLIFVVLCLVLVIILVSFVLSLFCIKRMKSK